MNCYFCGHEFSVEKVYRNTVCESCGKDAKICLNCTFYDVGAYRQCRESIPDAVTDKERANFCDYFSPIKEKRAGDQKHMNAQNNAKSQFDKLFGSD